VRIPVVGFCAIGCDGGAAAYGAKSPGHLPSRDSASFGKLWFPTSFDIYNHNVSHNTPAGCHDATAATSSHYDDDGGRDSG
jgi:hypothetical protein